MNAKQARNLQRIYQRRGCTTWRNGVVYSGREREGIQYSVVVLDQEGKTHYLHAPHERIGQTRTTVI